jgi:type III secretion system FlhB-like substrate exporter
MDNKSLVSRDLRKPRFSAAVALGAQDVPRIAAQGSYLSADSIVDIAHRSSIPVVEHEELARALLGAELDSEIPPSLYLMAAKVLLEVERLFATGGSTTEPKYNDRTERRTPCSVARE